VPLDGLRQEGIKLCWIGSLRSGPLGIHTGGDEEAAGQGSEGWVDEQGAIIALSRHHFRRGSQAPWRSHAKSIRLDQNPRLGAGDSDPSPRIGM